MYTLISEYKMAIDPRLICIHIWVLAGILWTTMHILKSQIITADF